MVTRMHAARIGTTVVIEMSIESTVQERSSSTERVRVPIDDGSSGLKCHTLKVNQAQLDGFCALLRVPATILMKALAHGELFHNAVEDNNEIPFLIATLECGVRLSFASLLRQFLSELPFHPL